MPRRTLPPNPVTLPMLTNNEVTALHARVPTSRTTSVANCVTCRGKGWFLWRDEDDQPVEYECNCPEQYLLHRALLSAGIPLAYQRLGWADYTYLDAAILARLGQFLEHQQNYLDAGFGLVIHGSKGNGKTLLANLVLKRLVVEGHSCYATTFSDMVDAFAGGWRDPVQERWFNQKVRNARVLYIDDVGREYVRDRFVATTSDAERMSRATADNRPGSMKETLLEAVIRHRVSNCLPTFISTNFTPEEITMGYGGHTTSLLGEKGYFLNVTGTDRRQDIKAREESYLLRGMVRPVVADTVGGA